LGPDHPNTLAARGLLSQALAGAGRYDEAIAVQQASLARVRSGDDARRAIEQSILATHLKRAQRYAEALPLAQESLHFYDAQSRTDLNALFVRRLLGEILLGAGRTREGTELLESVRELGLKTEGFQALPDWPAVLGALAEARRLGGDVPSAVELLGQAFPLLAKAPGPPRLTALRCQAERSWLLAMLSPQDAAAREAFTAAAQAYGALCSGPSGARRPGHDAGRTG
jgi:tetratricopeptide (TPR) repeat protein